MSRPRPVPNSDAAAYKMGRVIGAVVVVGVALVAVALLVAVLLLIVRTVL